MCASSEGITSADAALVFFCLASPPLKSSSSLPSSSAPDCDKSQIREKIMSWKSFFTLSAAGVTSLLSSPSRKESSLLIVREGSRSVGKNSSIRTNHHRKISEKFLPDTEASRENCSDFFCLGVSVFAFLIAGLAGSDGVLAERFVAGVPAPAGVLPGVAPAAADAGVDGGFFGLLRFLAPTGD